MSDLRELRDILAECMVCERLGQSAMPWAQRAEFHDEACEQDRMRADRMMRLLAEHGIALARASDPEPKLPPPTGDVIYRYWLVGKADARLIRRHDKRWQIVLLADGAETIEQEFTLDEVMLKVGLVLTDAPEALAVKGLGKQLAAVAEIFRMGAEGMTT